MLQMIAVVDDDAAVCDSIRILLEAHDLDVRTYLCGMGFLSENPDVTCVIVDYQMPRLNGLDLVAQMRERGSVTPAILMTGTNDPTVEQRATQLNVRQFLKKPLLPQQLLGALGKALE